MLHQLTGDVDVASGLDTGALKVEVVVLGAPVLLSEVAPMDRHSR